MTKILSQRTSEGTCGREDCEEGSFPEIEIRRGRMFQGILKNITILILILTLSISDFLAKVYLSQALNCCILLNHPMPTKKFALYKPPFDSCLKLNYQSRSVLGRYLI